MIRKGNSPPHGNTVPLGVGVGSDGSYSEKLFWDFGKVCSTI